MSQQVIHIYGASGSGTSTLGRYISKELGFFFMDTDDYFWLPTDPPYTTKRECSERLRLMKQDIEKHKNAVISGSLTDWGDELIPLFTCVIRLKTDTETRIARLRKREHDLFGSRIDPGGDMYKAHCEFIEWAAGYDGGDVHMRSKAMHDQWQQLLACKQLELCGSDSLESNYERLRQFLNAI